MYGPQHYSSSFPCSWFWRCASRASNYSHVCFIRGRRGGVYTDGKNGHISSIVASILEIKTLYFLSVPFSIFFEAQRLRYVNFPCFLLWCFWKVFCKTENGHTSHCCLLPSAVIGQSSTFCSDCH